LIGKNGQAAMLFMSSDYPAAIWR